MTRFEEDFYHALMTAAHEIAKQLKIANELKALELKSSNPDTTSMVDSIING